jgi:hypothetical protein
MGFILNKGETAFTVGFGAEATEAFMAGKWDFAAIWDNTGHTGMGQAECRELDENGQLISIRMDADKSVMKDKVPNWFIVDKSTQTIYFRLESDKFGHVRIAPFSYGQGGYDRGVLNVDMVESDILDIADGKTISEITDYLDDMHNGDELGHNRLISGNWLNIR